MKAILAASETYNFSVRFDLSNAEAIILIFFLPPPQDEVGCKSDFDMVAAADEDAPIDGAMANAIKALWADGAVQKAWDKRADYQVVETIAAFFSEIDRIGADDYSPTQEDLLKCRVRTSVSTFLFNCLFFFG